MRDFIKTVNGWPLIVRLLFCIPVLNIFYGICRIINQLSKNKIDALYLVLAILTVVPGVAIMWLIDLIWIIATGHAVLLG